MTRIRLAPWQLSVLATLFIIAANNTVLFSSLARSLDLASASGISFLLTIVFLIMLVLNTIILVLGVGRLQKPLIALLLFSCALFGYFSNQLGVVFDEDMFLNIAATVRDRNPGEAAELVSLPLFVHLLVFGILPAALLYFVEIVPRRFFREVGTRVLVSLCGVALLVAAAYPDYKYISYFSVEHRDLRFKVIPVFPIVSLVKLTRDSLHQDRPFQVLDAAASRDHVSAHRTVGIMVVGETARADHFSLDGYARETNPLLGHLNDVMYARATSCGTSTLFSVPCMFSMRSKSNYTPAEAATESNVLDILETAGVKTVWIDNNSSCKGVCDRIENLNLRQHLDKTSPYYSDMGYVDGVLIDDIDRYLAENDQDLLIVLHTLGSHGPAYSRRYPEQFGVFSPYCVKVSPTQCSRDEVANAYDNTILYTDYVLDHLIEKLKAHQGDFDSFLFYASDHGESLGENGVYLHGLPYAVAPAAQTTIPMLVWLSPEFQQDHDVSVDAARSFGQKIRSHDNISHTLLGFFDVQANSYRPALDLFAHQQTSTGTQLAATSRHPDRDRAATLQ